MAPQKKRTTLADVAKVAGVSVQTASHVLAANMTVRLPDSTRRRVMEAAEQVGYRPNRLAQAMKAGKTDLIGVWIPLDRPVMIFLEALKEINDHARKDGFDLMISGLDAHMAYTGEGKRPFSWPIDGLIAFDAGKAAARFREDPSNDSVPLVVVGLERFENSDSVAWNLLDSYKSVVRSLIESGRRKIVHVTPKWIFDEYPREQRRRGYREAMEDSGLEQKYIVVSEETIEASYCATAEAILDGIKPDAVVAFSDPIALGASNALQEAGVDVPRDCVVWGCGDFPEARQYKVPLSTIRPPIGSVVDRAWQMLMSRIKDPTLESRLEVLPMEVVARKSSDPKA